MSTFLAFLIKLSSIIFCVNLSIFRMLRLSHFARASSRFASIDADLTVIGAGPGGVSNSTDSRANQPKNLKKSLKKIHFRFRIKLFDFFFWKITSNVKAKRKTL